MCEISELHLRLRLQQVDLGGGVATRSSRLRSSLRLNFQANLQIHHLRLSDRFDHLAQAPLQSSVTRLPPVAQLAS